jgi:hypothetical protein
MKTVVLVVGLVVLAAVIFFALPGKEAQLNARIEQCVQGLSEQSNPMMASVDKPAFCGCVARTVDDNKSEKYDVSAMKPCIDQYIQVPAKKMCTELEAQTSNAHYDCNCFYDKLAAVILNHADATRNHRTVAADEAAAEQKQFEACVH